MSRTLAILAAIATLAAAGSASAQPWRHHGGYHGGWHNGWHGGYHGGYRGGWRGGWHRGWGYGYGPRRHCVWRHHHLVCWR